jgi:hypothetical protein
VGSFPLAFHHRTHFPCYCCLPRTAPFALLFTFNFTMVKYIFISGGVISGIGKGVIASSTALLMKAYGFRVTAIKIDPYLNIDAGTMSPLDHGQWCGVFAVVVECWSLFS